MSTQAIRPLCTRLPEALLIALEDLRHARSRRLGRRVSLRAMVQEALARFVKSEGIDQGDIGALDRA
jgi:hypothetical protein